MAIEGKVWSWGRASGFLGPIHQFFVGPSVEETQLVFVFDGPSASSLSDSMRDILAAAYRSGADVTVDHFRLATIKGNGSLAGGSTETGRIWFAGLAHLGGDLLLGAVTVGADVTATRTLFVLADNAEPSSQSRLPRFMRMAAGAAANGQWVRLPSNGPLAAYPFSPLADPERQPQGLLALPKDDYEAPPLAHDEYSAHVHAHDDLYASRAELSALHTKLDQMKSEFAGKVATLEGKFAALENTVGALDAEVTTLGTELPVVRGRVATLEGKVAALENTVGALGVDVTTLGTDVSTLQSRPYTFVARTEVDAPLTGELDVTFFGEIQTALAAIGAMLAPPAVVTTTELTTAAEAHDLTLVHLAIEEIIRDAAGNELARNVLLTDVGDRFNNGAGIAAWPYLAHGANPYGSAPAAGPFDGAKLIAVFTLNKA